MYTELVPVVVVAGIYYTGLLAADNQLLLMTDIYLHEFYIHLLQFAIIRNRTFTWAEGEIDSRPAAHSMPQI